MIRITSVSGNISGGEPAGADTLVLSRMDLEKRRLKRRTTGGIDLLILKAGGMRHGDILDADGRPVIVRQAPELTASVGLAGGPSRLVVLGHILGNMHRPISVADDIIVFPIQDPSEKETFQRVLGPIGFPEVQTAMRVFHPTSGAAGHA